MNIWEQLAEPFPLDVVGFKPTNISGNRCLALAYIDARDVMDRLDRVIGPENWQDSYTPGEGGTMLCRLTLRVGGEWIVKEDVGGESDQKDPGDRLKSAVSDALKRAAVKFSVGRYLYRLPTLWADYDPQKRCIIKPPTLPEWALPGKKPAPAVIITPDKTVIAAVEELDEATPLKDCPAAWSVVDLRCSVTGLSWPTLAKKLGLKSPDQVTVGHFKGIMERFDALQKGVSK